MTSPVDPWEPACAPAFQWNTRHTVTVTLSPGPERVVQDPAQGDPDWKPRPVGLTANLDTPEDTTP